MFCKSVDFSADILMIAGQMKKGLDKYKKSARAFAESCRVLPGGVNSPVRAFGGVDMGPLFVAGAKGSKIFDIDGNEYIDYVGSWGPIILGHAHPSVIAAVEAAAEGHIVRGAYTGRDGAGKENHCRLRLDRESSASQQRHRGGHDGDTFGPRLYQKDIIIKMAGCYHGHSDSLLVAAGSGLAESAIASSAGVPAAVAKLTIVVPYNDIAAVREAFARHKGKIAAVLVEPVGANMGVVPPAADYLEAVRKLCDADKVLLIFDEVITGFRLALGGAQERFGVKADITCLGKIIGEACPRRLSAEGPI